MKIKVEKKLYDDKIVRTEELHIEIPQKIIDELDWEDGTVVEWESARIITEGYDNGKIILRNIEGLDIGEDVK